MSSRNSPSIVIDCPPTVGSRLAVLLACSTAALVPWLVFPVPWAALASLAAAAGVFGAFRVSGWVGGPRALASATWSPDGEWWLTSRGGSGEVAQLLPDSRVFSRWLWLRWRGPSGRRQALLTRHSGQADAVRRLATRLRLQGTHLPTGSDSLPS